MSSYCMDIIRTERTRVSPKLEGPNLCYVLVSVAPFVLPPHTRPSDKFFILTQGAVSSLLQDYSVRHPGDKGKMPGFGLNDPRHFEGAWEKPSN
jgi:hypothetical protein